MPRDAKHKRRMTLIGYGLGRKLTVTFGALISVFVLVFIVFNVRAQSELVRERLALRSQQLLQLGLEISLPYLIEGRPGELEAIFEQISTQPVIEKVYLLDEYDSLIADGSDVEIDGFLMEIDDPLARQAFEEKQELRRVVGEIESIAYPIILGNDFYGTIRMDVRLDTLQDEIRTVWTRNATLGAIFLVLGLFSSSMLARRLTRPLIHLTEVTERAAAGDLDQAIDVATHDEIESLATSFGSMLEIMRGSMNRIRRLAYIDELTNLPNRTWFNDRIAEITVAASARNAQFAVMFLDVDDFKAINDRQGHHVGDAFLAALAVRLNACVSNLGLGLVTIDEPEGTAQNSALVARLGGDEFTMIVPLQFVEPMAEQIIEAMAQPFDLGRVKLTATTSIGIGVFPDNANSPNDLLKIADTAMYQAKQAGQNCYRYYDQQLHEEQLCFTQLQGELTVAISEGQFELFLQPQFEVKSGRISGAEALVRWAHPSRGLLSPDKFLPIAAETGLLPGIGLEISRLAIDVAQQLQSRTGPEVLLAINLSVEELVAPGFVNHLIGLIHSSDVDPSGLEIEITENTAMFDDDLAIFNVELLRSIGVQLAIDDFGVGFSNLARLKNLAFDKLKIDKSLLPENEKSSDATSLYNTILELSEVVGADVVAEGIETQEQLAFLASTHCRFYQGYLGGRPMPVDEFFVLLEGQYEPAYGT